VDSNLWHRLAHTGTQEQAALRHAS